MFLFHLSILIMKMTIRVEETGDLPELMDMKTTT